MNKVEEFNHIANDIENWHARKGTEINHDGELVCVDTAWACGFTLEEGNME